MVYSILTTLFLASCALALPLDSHDHNEKPKSLLQNLGIREWAHPADHPAGALFKRQTTANLTVGSPDWIAQYPGDKLNVTNMPQAWKDALANAEAAGLIPNITLTNEGNYPKGVDPSSAEICSSAWQCRGQGDIWDAPDGLIGISFDDGPTEYSPQLYEFLRNNSQRSTHFFIGSNIRDNAQIFLQAFNQGDDIATHTWSHPFMSSKTNAEIVAEIGWTHQIISDLTGGRVPRYWRPPYGDSDNRVRAIAIHIFGLTQVDWNQDTDDWELQNSGKTSQAKIAAMFKKWLTGPKSPGLMILEHELIPGTVQAFISAYPLMLSNGWIPKSIPELYDDKRYYQNAMDDASNVVPLNFIQAGQTSVDLSSTATTTGASSSSSGSTQEGTSSKANTASRPQSQLLQVLLIPFAILLAIFAS